MYCYISVSSISAGTAESHLNDSNRTGKLQNLGFLSFSRNAATFLIAHLL
jgi:hypothetical protein